MDFQQEKQKKLIKKTIRMPIRKLIGHICPKLRIGGKYEGKSQEPNSGTKKAAQPQEPTQEANRKNQPKKQTAELLNHLRLFISSKSQSFNL
jgi:hypothetical protein